MKDTESDLYIDNYYTDVWFIPYFRFGVDPGAHVGHHQFWSRFTEACNLKHGCNCPESDIFTR